MNTDPASQKATADQIETVPELECAAYWENGEDALPRRLHRTTATHFAGGGWWCKQCAERQGALLEMADDCNYPTLLIPRAHDNCIIDRGRANWVRAARTMSAELALRAI